MSHFKEPYELITAKIELAEIGLELYKVRYAKINTVRDLLEKEEELDKKFQEKAKEIEGMK